MACDFFSHCTVAALTLLPFGSMYSRTHTTCGTHADKDTRGHLRLASLTAGKQRLWMFCALTPPVHSDVCDWLFQLEPLICCFQAELPPRCHHTPDANCQIYELIILCAERSDPQQQVL